MIMLCSLALSAQLPDPDYFQRKQIGFNWLFDEDTVSINRLHVGDGTFGIDSLGKIIYYNGAAIAAGDILRGTAGGGSYTKLAKGTPLQVLRVNAGGTDLEWATDGGGTVTSIALATGTTGTDVNVSGSPVTGSGTITLNIPDASTTNRGLVTTGTQDIAGAKTFTSNISFEGSTADANETTLAITDPTADNTVTVQNITGTIPMAVGTPVSLPAQTAAIAATSAYTAPVDGYYQVCYNATITTAATSSCVLGPFQVRYTEAHDSVLKTFPTSSVNFVNATNRNNTDAAIGGVFTVHAKAGTSIDYIMGYTSSGATAMQYNLEVTIIKIR